jgi:neopullulanase
MKISQPTCKHLLYSLLLCFSLTSCAPGLAIHTKKAEIEKAEPPFWFANMAHRELEIMFYGDNLHQYQEVEVNRDGMRVKKITRTKNPRYLFVTVEIKDHAEGSYIFRFKSQGRLKAAEYSYELKKREPAIQRGLSKNDVIYLLFPDRFANGDASNDAMADMKEPTADRKGLKARHGGDLQGAMDRIPYIADLGCTALWINPVLENNQPYESYHGYAATDLYKVDPRFGSNELYRQLVQRCHKSNIKVVWDVVYNHWGNEHWLFKDLPDSNWVHWFPQFTRTNYRAETLMDPYASKADQSIMTNGWFDKHMPDLNQQDPLLATYLIQNSIWWIEYAGIDAFRIDTYAYPDQEFMSKLDKALMREYPDFFIFGETWVQGSPIQAWFPQNTISSKPLDSYMHGVTDFQLYYAITKGLMEPFGWEEGLRRIELTLSHDLLYKDAYLNVTHLDNHDLSRYYSMVKEDLDKWKMGMAMLLTLRGIPQLYYGTEILMKNYSDPDAKVREDFPGGWPGDPSDKFTPDGRTPIENEAFGFLRAILQWRRNNAWLGASKLVQFVPENDTYVYFRIEGEHLLMCAYNTGTQDAMIDLNRFKECLGEKSRGSNIVSGNRVSLNGTLTLAPKSATLIEVH